MKAVGFYYVEPLQFIVCIDHCYCLAPRNLKEHLQRNSYHGYKSSILHATLAAVSQLHVRDSKTIQPLVDNFSISYLLLETAY